VAELEDIKELSAFKDILYHVVYLGVGVAGFVYRSRFGVYHIFVNEVLSKEERLKVLLHEIHHIKKDMPIYPYIIGIDLQYKVFEKSAEGFVKEVAAKYIMA